MRIYILFVIFFSAGVFSTAQTVHIDSLRTDTSSVIRDTLAQKDTTGIFSDSTFQKADSIAPIHSFALSDKSEFITPAAIKFNDLRHTEDILNLYPFAFLQDYGSIGYPSRMYLYGTAASNYMADGKPVSTYFFSNGLDLNNMQMENIDSVEVLSLPRSVIYGSVPVNFIYKDKIPLRPYTKIKYYQGANGEAMFSGYFSTLLYRRLYGYLDVSNRKLDRSYANTAFSSWQVTGKLKYLASNDVNLNLTYNFSKLYKGLNGGIDVDSLTSNGILDKERMYNEILAPVNNYSQDTDEKLHNFDLNLVARPLKNFFTNASVYYHFSEVSLNNVGDLRNNNITLESKLFGANLRQYYTAEYFRLNFNIDYNYSDNKTVWALGSSFNDRVLGLSGIADLNLTSIIKPSVFYRFSKYSGINNSDNSYVGFDILFDKVEHLNIYAGYSFNQSGSGNNPLFQSYASYNYRAFYIKGDYFSGTKFLLAGYGSNVSGISGTLAYRLGSFELEAVATHYIADKIYMMPSDVIKGGFYFNDSLFRPNLLLKTGFKLNYIGKRNYLSAPDVNLPADYTIDFTLSGEIRKVAVVYFTWENLLDRKYYIVPYFPMYQRNIRFGVSWELFN